MINLKTLKGQVEYCLRHHPETRNSDIVLMTQIWHRFYGVGSQVWLYQLGSLPREDSVKRLRAMITKDGLYLPTKPEVAKKRRINEEIYRKYLGYNPELREV